MAEKISVPAPHAPAVDGDGVREWRPVFRSVEVREMGTNKILVFRDGKHETQFVLPPVAAAHIAALLTAAPSGDAP